MTNENALHPVIKHALCSLWLKRYKESNKIIKKKYEEEISKYAKEVACEGREECRRMKKSTYEQKLYRESLTW